MYFCNLEMNEEWVMTFPQQNEKEKFTPFYIKQFEMESFANNIVYSPPPLWEKLINVISFIWYFGFRFSFNLQMTQNHPIGKIKCVSSIFERYFRTHLFVTDILIIFGLFLTSLSFIVVTCFNVVVRIVVIILVFFITIIDFSCFTLYFVS